MHDGGLIDRGLIDDRGRLQGELCDAVHARREDGRTVRSELDVVHRSAGGDGGDDVEAVGRPDRDTFGPGSRESSAVG